MENSKLKILNISGKGFKKELLISSKEVITLNIFLKGIINDKVMIINTNVGLDVYYHSLICFKDLIVNAFLLLATSILLKASLLFSVIFNYSDYRQILLFISSS